MALPRKRFIPLRTRLLLSIVPLILSFMAFNFLVIHHHEERNLMRETEKRASSLAAGLSILSAEAILTFSNYLLDQNTARFGSLPDVVYAMVVGPDGEVQAHSIEGERGKRYVDPVSTNAVSSPIERIQYTEWDGGPILDVATPIRVDDRRLGTVRIGLSLRSMNHALAQSQRYLMGLTLVLISGALLFTGFITRWFTEPLLTLASVSRDLAQGNLSARAATERKDELGLLGLGLNHMASRLQNQVEREKKAREKLQARVTNLLDFTDGVMSGNLHGQAKVEDLDEMGQLTMAVNEMVRHLRSLLEEERATRTDLERSKKALEEAHEQLKEVDRLKSEFLNTVSHELRTPLTSIKAFAEILLENQAEDLDTQVEFLGIINKEADRLTRLINNLLDLSRIEAGKMQWDFQDVDLDEIVASAGAAFRAHADKKGLVLEVLHDPGMRMRGDRDKLVQVLNNLIGNAVKFTPEGGRIRVVGRREDERLVVTVQDTGIGIPDKFHDVIFEKFGRVDSSETRDIKGTGLGLSIAHSIVEAHGGTLTVDSQEGRGSTFRVILPALTAPERPRMATPPRLLGELGIGKRVLVVDDEENIRRLLRHILEAEGFQVLEARNGAEALARAMSDRPHVITLDIMLPDMDGFEVLETLKGHPDIENVPVVILSIIEDREKVYRLGAAGYLTKPIDRDALLTRVHELTVGVDPDKRDVLVVDDDASLLQALEVTFRNWGYRVRTARDGQEAIEEVRKEHPGLVILDLNMPRMSGHDVIQELKTNPETAGIPILVLTGSPPDDRTRAMGMGADALVSKPFSKDELAELVRETLAEASLAMPGRNHEDGAALGAQTEELT